MSLVLIFLLGFSRQVSSLRIYKSTVRKVGKLQYNEKAEN